MALPATENFASANAPLANSSNWGQCGATSTDGSGRAISGHYEISADNENVEDESAYWTSDSFANDQYAQAVVEDTETTVARLGVILRGSAGNEAILIRYRTNNEDFEAYYWNSSGSRIALSGNPHSPTSALVITDIIRGEIVSGTLTLKVDYGSGFVTETTWNASAGPSSGSAGIYIAGSNNAIGLDDWEGGNIGGGAATPHYAFGLSFHGPFMGPIG